MVRAVGAGRVVASGVFSLLGGAEPFGWYSGRAAVPVFVRGVVAVPGLDPEGARVRFVAGAPGLPGFAMAVRFAPGVLTGFARKTSGSILPPAALAGTALRELKSAGLAVAAIAGRPWFTDA